jgi:predicted nucleotidyltransferase
MDRQIPPGHASMRQTEMGEAFDKTLFAAVDAMEARKIPFAMIGGIAASAISRPRSTHDIDFFCRPEDADAALEALAAAGFETEKVDTRWLYKGWMGEMMVDIIFKSEGDIYFDDEMYKRASRVPYHGRTIPAVSPEDLIVIKAAVAREDGPHHWHDALAILSHATVDWNYLMKRARKAARRILSLLIYAQSNDIWIPNSIIVNLFQSIFGDQVRPGEIAWTPNSWGTSPQQQQSMQQTMQQSMQQSQAPMHSHTPAAAAMHHAQTSKAQSQNQEAYFSEKLREFIAKDPRTAALDIRVYLSAGNTIVARGEVQSEDQRQAIQEVICEHAKGYKCENQVKITQLTGPTVEEVV